MSYGDEQAHDDGLNIDAQNALRAERIRARMKFMLKTGMLILVGAWLVGCAPATMKVNNDGLDVADPNYFGQTSISFFHEHRSPDGTLDITSADYGKDKSTVVQALSIAAGLGALAITGNPMIGAAGAGAGIGAGYMSQSKPTTSTTTALVNALSKQQAVQNKLPAAVAP